MHDARHMLADRLRDPPVDELPTLVMSVRPRYAASIEAGQKRIEFRRRFPSRVTRARALVYVTAPVQAVQLACVIDAVHRAAPAELWARFGAASGVSREDFDAYFTGAAVGVALALANVGRLSPSLPLGGPLLRSIAFRPPQSLVLLPAGSPLCGFCLPPPRG